MDVVSSLLLAFITWALLYALSSSLTFRRLHNLPPGPFPIPIIGNIPQLGKNPNQSLAKLSKIYGPLMSLKLGTQTAIVVSSPAVAKEILQKNDHFFSTRPIPDAAHVHNHHQFSVAWLSTSSPQWRYLRKISQEQMLSSQKLDASQELRQEKLRELGDYLHTCSTTGKAVKIGEAAFTTTLNLMSSTLFSVNFGNFDSNSSQELKQLVTGVVEVLGQPNLADFFPLLKYFDPQGIRRRCEFYFGKVLDNFDDIIRQRQEERNSSQTYSRKQDLLEALLDEMAKDESHLSIEDIKHLLLVFFVAGTDTSAVTVEWGMAELLRNPEKMTKARAEIHQVIGPNKTVKESDISRLPYLQALTKEIFRLHPPTPLLIPHKADTNVSINGYNVPKDAHVLINIWASGRDPETWANPEMFVPERFMESKIEMRGQHFELIPFGAGRRICPGLPLGYRMVHLMLAFLIRNFEWKLEEGMGPENIDMEEHFGLSVQMTVPLKAIPVQV